MSQTSQEILGFSKDDKYYSAKNSSVFPAFFRYLKGELLIKNGVESEKSATLGIQL